MKLLTRISYMYHLAVFMHVISFIYIPLCSHCEDRLADRTGQAGDSHGVILLCQTLLLYFVSSGPSDTEQTDLKSQ